MATLQFLSLSSSIDPSFWHAFTKLKVDVLKLSDEPVPLTATYERARWIKDRETGQDVGVPASVRLDGNAFDQQDRHATSAAQGTVSMPGLLKNYNTIEEFKNADKQALFNSVADDLWSWIKSPHKDDGSQRRTAHFLLVAFADLKKYKYFYWFAFPAFVAKPAWQVASPNGWSRFEQMDELRSTLLERDSSESAWLATRSEAGWQVKGWDEADKDFWAESAPEDRYLIFVDPSHLPQTPGWPLRNLLAATAERRLAGESGQTAINVVAWRNDAEAVTRSIVATVSLEKQSGDKPAAVGWEKNAAGKLGPRAADLGPMMDPARLADQAVDLNLKLMRWRILPSLDLEKIARARCLLLGAGTLGCYVGRALMAWGVRKITLLDSAKVSFSNPVRQPLFEFDDCLEGGKPKAAAAAAALKRIYPGLDVRGVDLSIPMPGHPIPSHLLEKAEKDVDELEKLIEEHDVVYLLMDSRESRWLPTLLGAAKRKLVMNVALGFDSYLVMRHGVAAAEPPASTADVETPSSAPAIAIKGRLGCYFCNDIVAPGDSLTDRTLDQMCTVTRPGLAPLASATAVEMMASVLQHRDGILAQADLPTSKGAPAKQDAGDNESVLGIVPHQIRGFLARFDNMKLVGPAYDKCTGCSDTVVAAYREQGFDMLVKAFNDAKYLEQLTGLDKLYDQGEAALESVDWDEADEDDM